MIYLKILNFRKNSKTLIGFRELFTNKPFKAYQIQKPRVYKIKLNLLITSS
jgi:hypothetical protein